MNKPSIQSWLARRLTWEVCLCLLVLLVLSGCTTENTPTTTTTQKAVTVTSNHSCCSAITTPLAQPPQDCVTSQPPERMHLDYLGSNSDVRLSGGGVFWIYDGYYQEIYHLKQYGDSPWPTIKLVVEIGPKYHQSVTLRLRDKNTGALVWWTDGQTPPLTTTQTLVLNPLSTSESMGDGSPEPNVPHHEVRQGWFEWGIFPFFSQAGCYQLEANWSGGSWKATMAVGR